MSRRAIGSKGQRTRSKGQGEWSDIFLAVILSACIIVVAFKIPQIVEDIATLLTIASAEATARDLAGLITVSGAGQDSITIIYEGEDESIVYDVIIEDRTVKITSIKSVEEVAGEAEEIKSIGAPAKIGFGKIAVGELSESFENVRVFTIKKDRLVTEEKTYDDYEVSGGR